MNFKMIIAFVPDSTLDEVLKAARAAGATGSTVITSARGEGMKPERKFLGLDLASHRNLVFWLVEDHVAPMVMHDVSAAGRFEEERGAGIACQIDVEAAVGMMRHVQALKEQDKEEEN